MQPAAKDIRRQVDFDHIAVLPGEISYNIEALTKAIANIAGRFDELLEEFWSKNTPKQFASDEAKVFIEYLEDMDIKYLKEVLAFEEALFLANIEGKSTSIIFDEEPMAILNSLAERRLPEVVLEGKFRIDVMSDKIIYTNMEKDENVRRLTNITQHT